MQIMFGSNNWMIRRHALKHILSKCWNVELKNLQENRNSANKTCIGSNNKKNYAKRWT